MLKTIVGVVCSILLVGSLSTAQAGEQLVDFTVAGKKVAGTLNIPDGVQSSPVILLLHGFTGSRNELVIPSVKEGIFERAAHAWAKKGIASLRIDFMGCGDSDGDYADTTLQIEIADAEAALGFLVSRKDVDTKRISVVGWSMGGTVAATVAGRNKYPLAAVALWAPATNLASAMSLFLGPDVIKKGLVAGDTAVEATLPWGGTVKLKASFFKSMFEVDPVAEIANYKGPLFVAVGTEDTVVFPQPASGQLLLTYHDGPDELWVRPMDHSFNAFAGHETVDELINKTGDFIVAASRQRRR